jgi:hypothetical protein
MDAPARVLAAAKSIVGRPGWQVLGDFQWAEATCRELSALGIDSGLEPDAALYAVQAEGLFHTPMPHWTESTSTAVIFAFPVTDPPAQRQVPIMTRSLVNLASVGSVHHFSIRIADE